MKRVCILGLGYIGLPTAAMLAGKGFDVCGTDINQMIVDTINAGNVHIEEPELQTLVKTVISSRKLKAYTTPQEADIYIIAVPTPVKDDKSACMDYVEAATNSIIHLLKPNDLVILESTSPPETTKNILVPILEKSNLKIGEELFVAYCPEKVLPGKIIHELVKNQRIIGGINEKSAQMAKEMYMSFVEGEIFLTDSTTAEMVKIMENTYRDVNIALANELAKISGKLGINAWDVIKFANLHPRVNLHSPGPGVGGHCISVDPWFIVEKYPTLANLINTGRKINDTMPEFTYNLIMQEVKHISNAKVTILGITYKPDIDDIRESPSIEVVKMLEANSELKVFVHDPHVKYYNYKLSDFETAVKDSDCIVLMVNHSEFNHLNPAELSKLVKNKVIIDTRNALDRKAWETNGFRYVLLGNGKDSFIPANAAEYAKIN